MTSSTAIINIARTTLGLDEETYRAKLVNITGEKSLRKMTEAQLRLVIDVFEKEGFRRGPKKSRDDGRRELTGPYLSKLRALWIAGYNLGIIRNRDDRAMLAFIREQSGIEDTRFLRAHKDARAAIEGLKAWISREAGVEWVDTAIMPDYARADGFKVAWAQWRRLGGNVHAESVRRFGEKVRLLTGAPIAACGPKDWQKVMNDLGRDIRAGKGVAHG